MTKTTKPYSPRKNSNLEKFYQTFGKNIDEYESFKRATETLDPKTTYSYKTALPAYFLFLKEDPDTVIANRQKDIQSNNLLESERYERKTKAYAKILQENKIIVRGPIARIQGFFSNNSKRLSLDLKTFKYNKARKNRKYSPSQEDIQKLVHFADSTRDKFVVTVAYQNGLLPVDVANLCIGDYPLEPWTYFERSRSKTGEVIRGISTPDACHYLQEYMIMRKGKRGEPLIIGREGPADNETVGQILRTIITKSELDQIPGFIPKCLRDGFEDALVDANINRKIKEALMGHTSAVEHEYGSQKNLERRLVAAMKKVYPYISLDNKQNVVTDDPLAGLPQEWKQEIFKMIEERMKAKLQKS